MISVHASCGATTETVVRARDFSFTIDEPPLFHGENKAPSPVEYLLGAVAGCIVAAGQYAAREQGFSIRHMEVSIDGEIDPDAFFGRPTTSRAGFSKVGIQAAVECDASAEMLEQWREQVLKRCPVLDNLQTPCEIRLHVTPK